MRVLTSKQFEKEPVGTVYCKWIPSDFGGTVSIKGSERGCAGNSWCDLSMLPWARNDGDFDFLDEQDYGIELETDVFCTDDATYNYPDEQLWCVFSPDEVRGMIERLQNALIGIVD